MNIIKDAINYSDVYIVPKYSELVSRDECSLISIFKYIGFNTPIIPANMDTISEFKMVKFMADIGGIGLFHRYVSLDQIKEIYKYNKSLIDNHHGIGFSVGSILNKEEGEKIDFLLKNTKSLLCFDIANANSVHGKITLDYIREQDPYRNIIAGNVATIDGATNLIQWGADIVKVGIGPGSVCKTRQNTGIGYPQLQALLDISKLNIPMIADGGFKEIGDFAKALAVPNVMFCMTGRFFAGTDKTPNWVNYAKKSTYRGMASKEATNSSKYIEGLIKEVFSEEEGSTNRVFNEIHDGIRSAMSYVNACTLEEFKKNSEFVFIK